MLRTQQPLHSCALGHLRHDFQLLRRFFGKLVHRAAGLACRIVPLDGGDKERIVAHYAALSADDRAARFHSAVNSAAIERRYAELDWSKRQFIGAVAGRRVVALAEIAETESDGRPCCEMALSVLEPWQGSHIGERLMRAAIREVCGRRRLPLLFITRSDNVRMIRLIRKLGGTGRTSFGEFAGCVAPA